METTNKIKKINWSSLIGKKIDYSLGDGSEEDNIKGIVKIGKTLYLIDDTDAYINTRLISWFRISEEEDDE